MSRDGGTLAVYDNTKFSIYSYTNFTWPFVRTKTVSPYVVVLSHDGSHVAYSDGSLKVENTLTGASLGSISVSSLYAYALRDNTTLVLLQGANSASRLLFSGDETILVTGDSLNRDMSFFQYDATLAPPVFSFIQDGSAHSAAVHVFSGNGDVKVIGTSTDVEIIEASGTTTFTGAATSVDVSSDGTRVVVGTSSKMYVVNKSGGVGAAWI